MKFKIYLLSFAVILVSVKISYADSAGKSGMAFLKIAQGSRASGMGGVFSAISDDPTAIYWNPAGLSFQHVPELSAQFHSYIEDTSVQNIVFALPLNYRKPLTIAGGITLLKSSDFKKTVVDANNAYGFEEQGSFDSQDLSLTVGSGMIINAQASFGVNIKYIQETIDDNKATAGAADVGLILRSNDRPYRLGLLVQNIGTKAKFTNESFQLPRMFRLSVARHILSNGWIGFEGVHEQDNDLEFRFGVEAPVVSIFLLRFGYKYSLNKPDMGDYTGITAGMGFHFPYYHVDYAIVSFGDFGYTHRISMNVKFGSSDSRPAVRKTIDSPKKFSIE